MNPQNPSSHQRRVVTTAVIVQTAVVYRRPSDGMAWLHAPRGIALDADEAWALAQALVADDFPDTPSSAASLDPVDTSAAEIKALRQRIQAAYEALEAPLPPGVSTMRAMDKKWLAVRAALHPKES